MFGFLALNGRSVAAQVLHCKSLDLLNFLLLIRLANPLGPLIIILDNAKIHHANFIRNILHALNIDLIYLPPYSPDLNPIEFSFKDLRRDLSRYLDFDEIIKYAENSLHILLTEKALSYSKNWRQEFFSPFASLFPSTANLDPNNAIGSILAN